MLLRGEKIARGAGSVRFFNCKRGADIRCLGVYREFSKLHCPGGFEAHALHMECLLSLLPQHIAVLHTLPVSINPEIYKSWA